MRRGVAVISLLVVALGLSGPLYADIGFQARLTSPPPVVSPYEATPDKFSAAMYPLSYAVLDRQLVYTPQVEYGRFEENAITFNTKFYQQYEMVPVSVGAEPFLAYRLKKREREERQRIFEQSMKEAREGNKREGLSIGVALPKRFDQMFGEGGANLRVSGYRRITFSGRSQWTDAANSGINRQSKFPSLNMEQISRFDITGTIGTKISVRVSQDNQTDIPLANRLILRYKGDDDDILKSIEAGNTTLSLPNTRFVGYSQRIQGLFGLKAEAQLGNLRVIGIASQEKGSSEGASISASGEENATTVRDYQYAEGRIFDLAPPGVIQPGDSVKVIYIYEREQSTQDLQGIRDGVLMVDPRDSTVGSAFTKTYQFEKLDGGTDFELWYDRDSARCPIAVVFRASKREAMGVYMEILRYNGAGPPDTIVIGSVDKGDTDTLQFLMAERNDFVFEHPTWDMMWRNAYNIPKGSSIDDFEAKVYKGLAGREGTSSSLDYQLVGGAAGDPYVQILGLDQFNNNRIGVKVPDNKIDDLPDIFRPEWGLLIFPSRRPFDSDTLFVDENGNVADSLAERVPELYDYTSTTTKVESSKYYLQLNTRTRSSIIRLGRANIIEGSERVTLNGRVLEKGKDYNIQYDFGQVTMLTDEALDPNADIQIDFQYAPFLALQKKTLLGMRAEYDWSPDLQFGTTVLYKSDKAQDRKPRVGQETSKALVMDFDVAFGMRPNFLSKAVNALPLISTEAESNLRVTAEIAHSRPNPNVDGVAYIDDFEAAIERLSLGIPRTFWTESSQPLPIELDNETAAIPWARGSMRWHNPPAVLREDVYEGEVAAGEGSLTPLRLIFRPRPSVREVDDSGVCTGGEIPTRSWGGMIRYFGNRVDPKRVKLFEMRAKGGKGVLHFDFGRISEDVDGNGIRDFEDSLVNGSLDGGLSDPFREDRGLDYIISENEVDVCGNGYDAVNNPDPAGDNWWFEGDGIGAGSNNSRPPVPLEIWNDSTFQARVNNVYHWRHYDWINGTEGNQNDIVVQGIPDDESIDGDRSINSIDAYFTVAVPLNINPSNPFLVPGSGRNGWYTYRIPVLEPGVMDTVSTEGGLSADWSQISYVRVWFEKDSSLLDGIDSLASMDSLVIADWGFIQSNWSDTLIRENPTDTTAEFYVASVSEDEGTFIPPPGVEAYTDKVSNVTETQRGLALFYKDLDSGDVAITEKQLISTESYSGYRRMEMYVHGPDNLGTDQILFFMRVGRDTANYYEFQSLLKPGWDPDNYVNIDFNEITALKDAAERGLQAGQTVDTTAFPYRVVGRPNINEVRFLATGITNIGPNRVTGEVWVDELRVTDVRKDPGTAVRADISGSMADFISYSVGYEHRDPYFRGLSQATRGGSANNLGSGSESVSFNSSATVNMDKFLPRSWEARLPVTFGYIESEDVPLLRSNSDIILPDSIRNQEKSTSRSYKFSVRESFSKKGGNILFSTILNRQNVSFSYNRSIRSSVNNPYVFNENYSIRADYDMGIRKNVAVPLFFWTKPVPLLNKLAVSKLRLTPDQWTWSGSYDRTLRASDDRDFKRTSSFSRTFDGSMNFGYKPFTSLSTSMNVTTRRDLTDPALVRFSLNDFKLGLENAYTQNFRGTYDPEIFKWLGTGLQYNSQYSDSYDRSTATRNTALRRSWSVSGTFRHQEMLGKGGPQYGGRSSAPVRGGGERTEEKKGPPFYEPVLKGLRFMTGWLNPVTYRYSKDFSQSIPGAVKKPGQKYMLGLSTEPDFEIGSTSRQPSSRETIAYDFGSGFTVFGGLTTQVSFKKSFDRDILRPNGDRREAISTGWPELSLSISRLTFPPVVKKPINWFIQVFSPRTTYGRQIREDKNLENGYMISRSVSIRQDPLLSVSFKVWRSLSLSGSYGVSKTTDERFSTATGALQQETQATRSNWGVSSRYSFSSPGGIAIPLFGRVKFESQVTITLNAKFNSDLSETRQPGQPWVVGSEKSSFTLSPDISYQFSQQIRGGLTGRWQDTNDVRFNKKSHVRELRIWVELTF